MAKAPKWNDSTRPLPKKLRQLEHTDGFLHNGTRSFRPSSSHHSDSKNGTTPTPRRRKATRPNASNAPGDTLKRRAGHPSMYAVTENTAAHSQNAVKQPQKVAREAFTSTTVYRPFLSCPATASNDAGPDFSLASYQPTAQVVHQNHSQNDLQQYLDGLTSLDGMTATSQYTQFRHSPLTTETESIRSDTCALPPVIDMASSLVGSLADMDFLQEDKDDVYCGFSIADNRWRGDFPARAIFSSSEGSINGSGPSPSIYDHAPSPWSTSLRPSALADIALLYRPY